jgi:uncharacterized protein (TIGR02217 family)
MPIIFEGDIPAPDCVGLSSDDAEALLADNSLNFIYGLDRHDQLIPEGFIAAQSPVATTAVTPGVSTVTLYRSLGPSPPFLLGALTNQSSPRGIAIAPLSVAAIFTNVTSYGYTGTLPPGITFTGGILSGTPTVSGFFPNIVVAGTGPGGTTTLPPFDWLVYDIGPGYFPINLPGLMFSSSRMPCWKTGYQEALSGKASAISYQQYPVYEWAFSYELLRHDLTLSELKTLMGFFNSMRGRFGSFLFLDKLFNSVTEEPFGTGDGSKTGFQLTAAFQNAGGVGIAEIIQNLNGAPVIKDNGVVKTLTTHYTIGPTGIITFLSAPAAGHALTWSGSFYYRCRFKNDEQDFSEFLSRFWETKTLKFRSVIL